MRNEQLVEFDAWMKKSVGSGTPLTGGQSAQANTERRYDDVTTEKNANITGSVVTAAGEMEQLNYMTQLL